MIYRPVDLPIDLDTPRRQISERVDGLVVRFTADGVEFSTPSDFHLATLTRTVLPNGERGTRLKYRMSIVSSSAAHARRKAAEIRSTIDRMESRGS